MEDFVKGMFLLVWLLLGLHLNHRTRQSGCATRIMVAVFFTKGFILYYIGYGIYWAFQYGHVLYLRYTMRDK
jgi:hypothetical protein